MDPDIRIVKFSILIKVMQNIRKVKVISGVGIFKEQNDTDLDSDCSAKLTCHLSVTSFKKNWLFVFVKFVLVF